MAVYYLHKIYLNAFFSYVFHKILTVKGEPDSIDKQRWRCEHYGRPKKCMAYIHINGSSVVQEPVKAHICGEPDASRPYILKVSMFCVLLVNTHYKEMIRAKIIYNQNYNTFKLPISYC